MSYEQLRVRRQNSLGALRSYYDVPFHPVRAQGQWMFEENGRKILDAYNNVAHVGHCHPSVTEALCRQARTLNTNTRYLFEPVITYAERLIDTVGTGYRCIFTCTGSEANDLAWRLATAYTGNDGVVTMTNAYHGNTFFLDAIDGSSAKSAATSKDWWVRVPGPLAADINVGSAYESASDYATHFMGAVAKLGQHRHRPAAIYVEPYFITEGLRLPPTGYLDRAIDVVRKAGGVVIADEVQAGLSRSGSHVWSYQRLGLDPDIVVMGKPMGNGHPIGAVVAREEIVDKFYRVDRYFNTFAGNPVSCAAGLAVLDVVEQEKLQDNARELGCRIMAEIKELGKRFPVLGKVRGQGFLIGVEIISPRTGEASGEGARWIINEMCKRGVLVGTTGPNRGNRSMLKIRPPMIFDTEGLTTLIATITETLQALMMAEQPM